MTKTAIIAGKGLLPKAVFDALTPPPLVCALDGFVPQYLKVDQVFRVERLALFLRYLEDQGVTTVCFAGAVQRPRLDPSLFDPATATMVPRLLAALQGGDDATLGEVLAIFTEHGFEIAGAAQLAPNLAPGAGVYAGELNDTSRSDADRAAQIVAALGAVDVGQGAVVAQGLCLAVEALPGTDAMLRAVAMLDPSLRPDPLKGRGVFYKAPKPGQNMAIDMPALGVETIRLAAAAGLQGVGWPAGGVICLDLPQMIAVAQAEGLYLWSRPE